MNWWFWVPMILAGISAFVWICAAVGYNRGRFPLIVSANAFNGPVREYVFPGGFIAALGCILTNLLVDRISNYPPASNTLLAAAILLVIAALLGLILFQWLENKKDRSGQSITLSSSGSLALYGAIIAIIIVVVLTLLASVTSLIWLPPKSASTSLERPTTNVTGGRNGGR